MPVFNLIVFYLQSIVLNKIINLNRKDTGDV